MGDQLKPVQMGYQPIRVNRRREGHGKGGQDHPDQNSDGQKKKKRNKINKLLGNEDALDASEEKAYEAFHKLLEGEHS